MHPTAVFCPHFDC
jgi:transposase-like protein